MFPTLGHLINYIFGTQINFPMPTYGFVLVMAFVTAGIVLNFGLRRKERLGFMGKHPSKILVSGPINYIDIFISSFFYFALFFKIVGIILNYDEFTKDINEYIFSLNGSWIAGLLAAAASIVWAYIKAKEKESPEPIFKDIELSAHQITINIVMVAALSGIIGAKLFDILENLGSFFNDPIGSLFSAGGFTFYGGLIAGSIAVVYYTRKRNINTLHLIDAAAPSILAAYAVGRMACMLSGDGCWGIPNPEIKPEWLAMLPDWMWAYDFPHNVINEGVKMSGCHGDYCHMLNVPVFPTPFYESSLSAMFFLFIWFIQNKVKAPGTMFFIALMLNGITRFFVEKIRVNNVYSIGSANITQAEIISTILVIIGIVGIILLRRFYRLGKIK